MGSGHLDEVGLVRRLRFPDAGLRKSPLGELLSKAKGGAGVNSPGTGIFSRADGHWESVEKGIYFPASGALTRFSGSRSVNR